MFEFQRNLMANYKFYPFTHWLGCCSLRLKCEVVKDHVTIEDIKIVHITSKILNVAMLMTKGWVWVKNYLKTTKFQHA